MLYKEADWMRLTGLRSLHEQLMGVLEGIYNIIDT